MSIFHVLYKSYIKAEENGQVDAPELDTTNRNIVILPIYHANLRSDGKNVAQIVLDDEGAPIHLNFLEKDVYTIFPVTEDSLNRTSNPFAHPLCDDMQYLSKCLDERKYSHFCEQNEQWVSGVLHELADFDTEEARDAMSFVKQIRELILNNDILAVVKKFISKRYKVLKEDETTMEVEVKPESEASKAETKKYDLSKLFITFGKQFSYVQKRDLNITTNKLLHKAHVSHIQKIQATQPDKFDLCDISGKKVYCSNRHRGLLGKGKIVSVSNNMETYRGRFRDGSEVVRLGAGTSEKIHLMLKFFLEHQDNSQGLYQNTTAVIWFAEDLLNERQFSLSNPTMDPWDNPEDGYEITTLADERAREWKKILRGEKPLPDDRKDDFFYFLMINKISNGRIAIQGARTIPIVIFLKNIQRWQQTCSWEIRNSKTGKREVRTPRPWDIIRFVYGIEGDNGWVDCLNNELKSAAFKRILPSIIDGVPLPRDMARQIFSNYKNRIGFRKNWRYLQYMSCALLNKVRQDGGKERRIPMLEKEKQTRDYLYGRLLAIYEKVEMDAMTSPDKKDDAESNALRITNVEKVWSAFFQAPERMLETLHMKVSPYLHKLKANQAGKYRYYNNLIGEIQTEIRDAETYIVNKNKALNEDAVFGYYAQNKDLYTPRAEKKENENAE